MISAEARRALSTYLTDTYRTRMDLLIERLSSLPHAATLRESVPTPGLVDATTLAFRVVEWLDQNGLVDQSLFDLLAEEQPARERDLRAVQRTLQRTVLFLTSTPSDLPALEVEREAAEVIAAIRGVFGGRAMGLIVKHHVEVNDWRRHLTLWKPEILHFSGHGDAGGMPVLQGPDGAAVGMPIAPVLAQLSAVGLRGAFFNACDSGRLAKAAVETAGLPWAIGADRRIPDATARSFATGFYEGLALGRSPREAYDDGRARCQWDGLVLAEVLQFHSRG